MQESSPSARRTQEDGRTSPSSDGGGSTTSTPERSYMIQLIRDWVKKDNDLRELQKECNKIRNEKKNLTNQLTEFMKSNSIDCFDINGGMILYKKTNTKKPINQKTLIGLLSNYFQNDTTSAVELNKYILENRENVVKEKIVRILAKSS